MNNKFTWKTTVGGVIAVLSGLGMIGKIVSDFTTGVPVTFEGVTLAVATIGSGIGLIFARDNNVTSEEAGAK